MTWWNITIIFFVIITSRGWKKIIIWIMEKISVLWFFGRHKIFGLYSPSIRKRNHNILFFTLNCFYFLSGLFYPQIFSILLQCGLPQPTLAQIWQLSDQDGDGRLSRSEFIAAMSLCDAASKGIQLPFYFWFSWVSR